MRDGDERLSRLETNIKPRFLNPTKASRTALITYLMKMKWQVAYHYGRHLSCFQNVFMCWLFTLHNVCLLVVKKSIDLLQ